MKSLILAGGSGKRLFPLSRSQFPKQFIQMFDRESLFQKTVKRALLHSPPEEISVVTNRDHTFLVRDQLSEIGVDASVLVEPEAKNTLPAVYFGISRIIEDGDQSTIAIFPSDQYVVMDDTYTETLRAAEALAADHLIVFGVTPTFPHTGYGYIRPGESLGHGYTVDTFVEKPDFATAQSYLSEGYLWNSGMFVFNSVLFLNECEQYAPDMVEAFTHPTDDAYALTPNISVDYAILEKTRHAAVVPFHAYWNDLGSFDALYELSNKDQDGNAVRGEFLGLQSNENLVISDRLVAAIGISGMAIVDTRDALLLCPKNESQNVGKIVEMLRRDGDERTELHTTVYRPWGSYTLLEKADSFEIKRVTILPKKRLSHQLHHHRSEHWVIVKGTALATIDGSEFFLRPGESTFVPAGVRHRLENPGLIPVEVIEVQNGQYIGEDDIVRFEDDFGRVDETGAGYE